MPKPSRFDNLKLGTVMGLVVPATAILIVYLFTTYSKVSFVFFVEYWIQKSVMSKILSLALLPNLPVFFLYIWKNYYHTARGILMSTILWTFAIVVLKIAAE